MCRGNGSYLTICRRDCLSGCAGFGAPTMLGRSNAEGAMCLFR
jgi:hypothetical protein